MILNKKVMSELENESSEKLRFNLKFKLYNPQKSEIVKNIIKERENTKIEKSELIKIKQNRHLIIVSYIGAISGILGTILGLINL